MENILDTEDPALALLKRYVDSKIKEKVETDLPELQTAIEEQIKDVYETIKDYVNMKIETVQRDVVAHIDTSMTTMWENVQKEIEQNMTCAHDDPEKNEDYDVLEVSVLESAGDNTKSFDDNIDFKDIEAQIETKYWGKTLNTQKEPVNREEGRITDDDLEESPAKKTKQVRARRTPAKKQPKSNAKLATDGPGPGPGRPKGAINKTIKKKVLSKEHGNLAEENAKLKAQIEELTKKK